MRFLLFATLSTLIFGVQSSSAADSNCAIAAGNAAFNLALPLGNKPDSPVFASIESTKLLRRSGSHLYYEVQIHFEVTSGYSDGFPPEVYAVEATGTEQKCRVVKAQLIK